MKKLPPAEREHNRKKSWREYFWRNREKRLALSRRLESENKPTRRAKRAEYYRKNMALLTVEQRRDRFRTAKRRRMLEPAFVILNRCRSRLANALKPNFKTEGTLELLGCSSQELRQHVEGQFKPGMSWQNRGAWHLDHRRPIASFDLLNESQRRECFHFSNLQPLWKAENLSKHAKIIPFEAAA